MKYPTVELPQASNSKIYETSVRELHVGLFGADVSVDPRAENSADGVAVGRSINIPQRFPGESGNPRGTARSACILLGGVAEAWRFGGEA